MTEVRQCKTLFKKRPIFEHFPYTLNGTFLFRILYKKIINTEPIFVIYEKYPNEYYYFALRYIKILFFKILILETSWETTGYAPFLFNHAFYILTPLFKIK